MRHLNLKQQLIWCDTYKITPNELFLFEMLLLIQEDDNPELVKLYFSLSDESRGSIHSSLQRLQEQDLINKSYKIPPVESNFNPYDVPLNKNKVKQFYKCSFELGKDLWDAYPQFGLVNGNTVGLRAISDKDDTIEDFFARYGKEIKWNPAEHKRIIELINWAKEYNIINYTISKFVRNHKWDELEALKNGDSGYNYDVVKLI